MVPVSILVNLDDLATWSGEIQAFSITSPALLALSTLTRWHRIRMKGRKMPQDKLLRDFAVVYGVLTTLQVIPRLSPKESPKYVCVKFLASQHFTDLDSCLRRNVKLFLHKGLDPEVLRHAIFAMTLPRTYGFLRRRLQDSDLPVGLSSLLIYLVKPSYRRTLVVYIALAAATNFKRDSPLRRSLPPTWTLYLFGNAWLLWAFLFHPKVFPRTYGEVIMRVSFSVCTLFLGQPIDLFPAFGLWVLYANSRLNQIRHGEQVRGLSPWRIVFYGYS